MINEQFPIQEFSRGRFLVSTDPKLLKLDTIHQYLSQQSYWAQGIAKTVVAQSIRFSFCWGVYDTTNHYTQVGFCRAITDFATYAYLSDVFILPEHQGRGLGKWLVQCALSHPELQAIRKWQLDTRDAQSLYTRFGFHENPHPEQTLLFRPSAKKG